MQFTEDAKAIIEGTDFPTLATLNEDGTPHLIVTGPAAFEGDELAFGIGGMVVTQANLARDNRAWMTFTDKQPKGIRIAGTAEARDGKLFFAPSSCEALN